MWKFTLLPRFVGLTSAGRRWSLRRRGAALSSAMARRLLGGLLRLLDLLAERLPPALRPQLHRLGAGKARHAVVTRQRGLLHDPDLGRRGFLVLGHDRGRLERLL